MKTEKVFISSIANPNFTYNPDDKRWVNTEKANTEPYAMSEDDAKQIIDRMPSDDAEILLA